MLSSPVLAGPGPRPLPGHLGLKETDVSLCFHERGNEGAGKEGGERKSETGGTVDLHVLRGQLPPGVQERAVCSLYFHGVI